MGFLISQAPGAVVLKSVLTSPTASIHALLLTFIISHLNYFGSLRSVCLQICPSSNPSSMLLSK